MGNVTDRELLGRCEALLYEEARRLDRREWDEWIDLFLPEASFWIPMWDDEYTLTDDPQSQLSLMYYPDRTGLEDRIFRLRTERSSASTPLPRTVHMVSNIEAQQGEDGAILVYANGEVMSYRHKQGLSFYCHYDYQLRETDVGLKIAAKKVVVANDVIHDIMDIYSI